MMRCERGLARHRLRGRTTKRVFVGLYLAANTRGETRQESGPLEEPREDGEPRSGRPGTCGRRPAPHRTGPPHPPMREMRERWDQEAQIGYNARSHEQSSRGRGGW